jgi:uncharacterized membrane protein
VAILVIAIGAIEALIGVFRVMLVNRLSTADKRGVWLQFARWLVAALTFQVAADVVHTAIAPT